MTCQASRRWSTATTSRLYSSASSRARSVTWLVDRLDLDPQRRAGAGDTAADPAAALGLQHGRRAAAPEPADLLDGRDHAVRRVAVLEPRGDAAARPSLLGAGGVDGGLGRLVELDRDHHAGQHDEVGHEQDGKTLVGHDVLAFENLSDMRLNSRAAVRVPARHPCSSRANMVVGRTVRPFVRGGGRLGDGAVMGG